MKWNWKREAVICLGFNFLTLVALPTPSVSQQPQIVHYGKSEGMPSLRGTLVAVRFGGRLGDATQGYLSVLGVDDFVIMAPSSPQAKGRTDAKESRTYPSANNLFGANGFESRRTESNDVSSVGPTDPCGIAGYAVICISITEPVFVGRGNSNNNTSFFYRRGASSTNESRSLDEFEVSVRIDLFDNRVAGHETFTPLAVSYKFAFSGNSNMWYGVSSAGFGNWANVSQELPLNTGLAQAVSKAMDNLFKKQEGWRRGAASAVYGIKWAAQQTQPDPSKE